MSQNLVFQKSLKRGVASTTALSIEPFNELESYDTSSEEFLSCVMSNGEHGDANVPHASNLIQLGTWLREMTEVHDNWPISSVASGEDGDVEIYWNDNSESRVLSVAPATLQGEMRIAKSCERASDWVSVDLSSPAGKQQVESLLEQTYN